MSFSENTKPGLAWLFYTYQKSQRYIYIHHREKDEFKLFVTGKTEK